MKPIKPITRLPYNELEAIATARELVKESKRLYSTHIAAHIPFVILPIVHAIFTIKGTIKPNLSLVCIDFVFAILYVVAIGPFFHSKISAPYLKKMETSFEESNNDIADTALCQMGVSLSMKHKSIAKLIELRMQYRNAKI